MGISFNGFVAETRRHFRKYTPQQQSQILFKFSLSISVIAAVLIGTGIFVDQLHNVDAEDTVLKNGSTFHAAGSLVGHKSISLEFPNCETPETGSRENSILFDPRGVKFKELLNGVTGTDEVYDFFVDPGDDSIAAQFFGTFHSYWVLGTVGQIFAFCSVGLLLLSVAISTITKTPPNSFLSSEPTFQQTKSQMTWGAIHHSLTIAAVVCLMTDLAISSTYVDLLLGRVIELSFELCNFNPGGDTELEVLKVYGNFLQDYSQINGATGTLFKIAIGLLLAQTGVVFFLGTDQVRSSSGQTSYSIAQSRLRSLPWFAFIWKMRYSILLFLIGIGAEIGSSVYTRIYGYFLNVRMYTDVISARTGSGLSPSGALPDWLLDVAATYYISDSVPIMVTIGWLMVVFLLSIGSMDPWRFLSKFVQLLGILLVLRAIVALCSIYPVPSTVLTNPDCYENPMKGKDGGAQEFHFMSREALSCNHTMFSIFAAITTMCIWILILYIRFGPLKRWKFIAYAILMFDNLVCGLLPVIARVNYSVEVFIGAMIAAILVMSQSAAFKLLFRFEQNVDSRILMQQANGESELLNDRIIPTMYEIKKRMEAYTRAAKFSSGLKIDSEELNDISNLYKDLGNGIDKAKNAKPLAPMSAAGLAISKPPPDPQNESPQAAEIPDAGVDANELVNMIAQAQDTSST
jgi:hypothetical protein